MKWSPNGFYLFLILTRLKRQTASLFSTWILQKEFFLLLYDLGLHTALTGKHAFVGTSGDNLSLIDANQCVSSQLT
jgi:hypothetical protein